MSMFSAVRIGSAALLCGALLLSRAPLTYAQGANWSGYTSWPTNPHGVYNPALPAYPKGFSTDPAVIAAQAQAGAALKARIQSAISAGKASYTVAPGVYRFADSGGVVSVLRVNHFTLNAPGCTFILANPQAHLVSGDKQESDPLPGICSDITVQGAPGKPLIVDRDLLGKTQGTITAYNPATGIVQVKLMPGYSAQVTPVPDAQHPIFLTAYSSDGSDIPFGYYHDLYGKCSSVEVDASARTVRLTLSDAADRLDASHRYAVGNFVTLPTTNNAGGVLASFERTEAHNLTLRDIANGIGGPLLDTWAGILTGTTHLIRVRNGAPPGTNRLGTSPCAQISRSSGDVVIDGCEFGDCWDDGIDIQANGFKMFYKTAAPNQVVGWNIYGGLGYKAGDTISIYADKNFANVYTGKVTTVEPYTDEAALADAAKIWNSSRRRSKSGGSLVVLTLDKPVTGTTPGDFLENDSERLHSITMTNCYWHGIGVRVMVEGIQNGTFTHNMFDAVNGGLAVTSDPYWAQGGTCQNVTIDNNIFRNCRADKVQSLAALVLGPLRGSGPLLPGQQYSFQNYAVTHNTFIDTGGPSISAHMVGNLTISRNLFRNPNKEGGSLNAEADGNTIISDNRFFAVAGNALNIKDCTGVTLARNYVNGTLATAAAVQAAQNARVKN